MRFTVRQLMVLVALVAVALATECALIRLAFNLVVETHGDGTWEYIPGEAVAAWGVLHVMLTLGAGTTVLMVKAAQVVLDNAKKRYR